MSNYTQTARTDPDLFTFQVRRMRSMKRYPKDEDDELIRVARQFTPFTDALCEVINEILNDWESAPQPSELKRMLLLRKPESKRVQCSRCGGTGFRMVYKLITKEQDPHTGYINQTFEPISEVEYKNLGAKLDPKRWDRQAVYSGAERCNHQVLAIAGGDE